ncbi:MAG: hypothetical protein DA330_06460 [Nitrososphaera sp.]|nr:hypothetical protein [Nitrososphaera sp.]
MKEAIKNLETATDPCKLGTFKKSRKYTAYFYELNSSERLVYDVYDAINVIAVIDIGDHKRVMERTSSTIVC